MDTEISDALEQFSDALRDELVAARRLSETHEQLRAALRRAVGEDLCRLLPSESTREPS